MVSQFLPEDQDGILGLISSDNRVLNKVLRVLAALCNEVLQLKHEAETNFYAPFLLYGEGFGMSMN